ncbi:hypothetical protein D2Q93_07150 [Alicyclobacillaceae bacterium I2511]|nr:hypothetical protein D2Q93_07150 [Alicyclobacillaceae bacterium I2511]
MKTRMAKVLPGLAALGILTVGGSVAWASVNSTGTPTVPTAPQATQGAFQPGNGPMGPAMMGHRHGLGQELMQGQGQRLGLGPSGGVSSMQGVLNLLHVDAKTLIQERQSGKSLADIAKVHGVSEQALVTALTEQNTQRIQQALQSGRITSDEAAAAEKTMQSRIQQAIHNQATHQGPRINSLAPTINNGI